MSEPQELGLAAQELELARPGLGDAPFDVAVLFGRNGEERDAAGQLVERLGVEEPDGRAQHAGDLRVVAAGVRGAGVGIAFGMAGNHERVELAEHREGRSVTGPATDVGAHAGQRETRPRGQPELLEGFLDEPGGLDFLEPQLRVAADLLTEADDLVRALVDRLVDPLLQLVPGHVVLSLVASLGKPPDILLPPACGAPAY